MLDQDMLDEEAEKAAEDSESPPDQGTWTRICRSGEKNWESRGNAELGAPKSALPRLLQFYMLTRKIRVNVPWTVGESESPAASAVLASSMLWSSNNIRSC